MNTISVMTNLTSAHPTNFDDLDHLARLVIENDWSHSIFRENYRNASNFSQANLVALDVDEGCSIDEAKNLFKDLRHIIVTSRNHQKPKDNKPACDRFRIILPLENPITEASIYTATWNELFKKYPFIDRSCKDTSRFWYKGTEIISINHLGVCFTPAAPAPSANVGRYPVGENKGVIARSTQNMINGAPPKPGSRNTSLFKAALDCRQQGYSYEDTVRMLSGKSTLSQEEEERTIKSGWNREPKYPPRQKNSNELPTELWVKDWLYERSASLDYKSNMLVIDGDDLPFDQLLSRISLDAENERLKYSDDKIKHALNVWMAEQKKSVVASHISKIEFDSELHTDAVSRFLIAATGSAKPLEKAVLCHFIWQIKRKLLGLKVGNHLMPIFVGKHRGGKTEAIKKLLGPIEQLCLMANDMTVITDERGIKALNDNYCIFFDEMAKAGKVDADRMKNIITSEYVSYRIMRTNQYASLRHNSVFIGATNHHVRDLIFDHTSARRFYEIPTLNVLNHQEINSIPYLEIWKSINPIADSPIVEFLSELDHVQESEIRNKCFVEEWLTSWCKTIELETPHQQWSKPKDLYMNFKQWLDWQNKISMLPTYNKFLNRIADFKRSSDENGDEFSVADKVFRKRKIESGMIYSIGPIQDTYY